MYTNSFFYIANATAFQIKKDGRNRIGLLGTKFAMEEDVNKGRLIEEDGIDVIVPTEEERSSMMSSIRNSA